MISSADVVVIGAGITGTSAAFQLAQRGLRVALVEKKFIAAGSTGKSSAIIRQHYSNAITARMALYSLRVFQNFADVLGGGDAGFVTTGFAILVAAKDRAGLIENVAMQKRVGVNTRIISSDELRELNPGIAETRDIASAYEPESGYSDPASSATGFADAAKRLGTQVYQETRVIGIEMSGGRVIGVKTTNGMIATGAVVNCANAWAPEIGAMVGVNLPVQAERHQVATFQRPADFRAPHFTAGDFINNIYYRPEGALLTLAGSIDPHHGTPIDPDNYNESADYEFIEDMATRIRNRYPVMERAFSKGGWSGIYGVTPDWHPIIDEIPAGSGFFVAAGFSGHGYKLGPAVGVMIADLVTRASAPTAELDRALFRYARFAENTPVRGKYEYSIVG
ncbi:MAG: FAD-binding oxidoreductase [Chloroflexi bacterium]|nr:FAD-binding oxidoreductase [Chloroflexota bacterium]